MNMKEQVRPHGAGMYFCMDQSRLARFAEEGQPGSMNWSIDVDSYHRRAETDEKEILH